MLLWGGWGLLSKPLSNAMSPWQVQTLSFIGELPVILILLLSKQLTAGADLRRGFWLAFGSGVLGSLGNVAYYAALASGAKAAAATPLTALYPVVTIGLALAVLGERLNRVQAAGAVLSLAAIWLFNVGTDASWLSPWIALSLLPIGLWGVAALLQKVAAGCASSELVTAGFLLGAFPVALLTPVFVSFDWQLGIGTWGLLCGLGLLFGLGNLALILAYGNGGRASVVTPLAGLYSIVTIPLAVLLLGEQIGWREGLGIGVALVAAALLSYESGDTTASAGVGKPVAD
jgi:drug/metabolite transporter (DMT)-like permease